MSLSMGSCSVQKLLLTVGQGCEIEGDDVCGALGGLGEGDSCRGGSHSLLWDLCGEVGSSEEKGAYRPSC